MGLDMYLKGKRWMTDWPEQPEESKLSSVISELFPNNVRVTSVTAEIGYWRKSNAKYFLLISIITNCSYN